MKFDKLSVMAAVAVVAFGLDAAADRAEAATVNDFAFAGQFPGNDCAGDLGAPPNCTWNDSPMIAKFDFNDAGMVTMFTPGVFTSIDGTEFAFSFDVAMGMFSWTYTPNDPTDPGITAFSVKGGPAYRIYEKGSPAFLAVGDFSDTWVTPLVGGGPDGGNLSGVSHLVFFDSTTPIPLPAAAWLLLSGLAGLGVAARRKRAVG